MPVFIHLYDVKTCNAALCLYLALFGNSNLQQKYEVGCPIAVVSSHHVLPVAIA